MNGSAASMHHIQTTDTTFGRAITHPVTQELLNRLHNFRINKVPFIKYTHNICKLLQWDTETSR